MDTVACPRCSKALPRGTSYCRRCGARIAPAAASTIESPAPAGPEPRGRRFVLSVIAGALFAAVAVGMLVGVMRSLRRPSSASPAATKMEIRPTYVPPVPMSPGPQFPTPRPPLPELPAWERHLPPDLPPQEASSADYRGQLLTQGRFLSMPLSDAIFAGAHLLQASFERADLDGADFRGADLSQANLAGADLDGARFDGAKLHQTHLVSLDTAAVAGRTRVRNGVTEPVPAPPLLAKNAGKASFRSARFSQVSLEGLDLVGADFGGAEFSGVEFRNADLRNANLRDTRHRLTDFEGAKLDGADLRGADLYSARNLTAEQLASARTDATTRRPR